MTDEEREMRRFLEFIDTPINRYVLEEGRMWEPQELPGDVIRGEPKHCFKNAYLKAVATNGRYRYVEGYACSPKGILPVLHAWVVDEDDCVLELTWPWVGVAYLGVEFSLRDVTTYVAETGVCGS
jgi:hypothetical protein